MRIHSVIVLVLALWMASACNLGTTPTQEPLLTPDPTDTTSGEPTVNIISPRAGDEFVVDEQILVSANATDRVGVTRMQLLANGQIVKTVSSQSVSGDTTMSAILDYAPRSAGAVTLQVIAFRGSRPSAPAEISINVRSQLSQITATSVPQPGGNIPVIPNDGVCRALVNTGLNLREGPGTEFKVIRVLPSGSLEPIIGRLGNNSWWKLRVGGTVEGWVSAEFTTPYGNCSTVPVSAAPTTPTTTVTVTTTATLTPTITVTPGTPDLVVTGISGDTAPVIPAGEAEVKKTYAITITNSGFGPTGQFSSRLTFNNTSTELAVVSNLNAGESISLNVEVSFPAAADFALQVTVDPDDTIKELSEVNNQGILSVKVTKQ